MLLTPYRRDSHRHRLHLGLQPEIWKNVWETMIVVTDKFGLKCKMPNACDFSYKSTPIGLTILTLFSAVISNFE